jgi:hypothetical protein
MATDSYEPAIAAQWEDNKQRIREQVIHEFDNATSERKDRRLCRAWRGTVVGCCAPLPIPSAVYGSAFVSSAELLVKFGRGIHSIDAALVALHHPAVLLISPSIKARESAFLKSGSDLVVLVDVPRQKRGRYSKD